MDNHFIFFTQPLSFIMTFFSLHKKNKNYTKQKKLSCIFLAKLQTNFEEQAAFISFFIINLSKKIGIQNTFLCVQKFIIFIKSREVPKGRSGHLLEVNAVRWRSSCCWAPDVGIRPDSRGCIRGVLSQI